MNPSRSCLDPLNAGRPRKAYVAFEELSRSLENPARQSGPTSAPPASDNAVDRFALDLEGLRGELRRQMAASLQREFDMLRKDIEMSCAALPANIRSAALAAELDRLSLQVRTHAERGDDHAIDMLRLTLKNMKKLVDSLNARNDIPLAGQRLKTPETGGFISRRIDRRIDEIAEAMEHLPDAGHLRALDEKIRTLTATIENFMDSQGRRDEQTLAHMEERLDEVSRGLAAAASFQPKHFDAAALQRIETGIAALTRKMEGMVEDRPASAVMGQLSDLSQRVEQIAAMIERKGDGLEAGGIQKNMDEGFSMLADILERREKEARTPDTPAVSALADDMKSLEMLVRYADERNNRTFEAIHDTLLKVVDRIGALERGQTLSGAQAGSNSNPPVHGAPDESRPERQAAPSAAAAPGDMETTGSASLVRSMFGSIGRAFSGHGGAAGTPMHEQPVVEQFQQKCERFCARELRQNKAIEHVNDQEKNGRALEPRPAADLNAIMRRVRDEHSRQRHLPDRESQVSRTGTGRA